MSAAPDGAGLSMLRTGVLSSSNLLGAVVLSSSGSLGVGVLSPSDLLGAGSEGLLCSSTFKRNGI
jgi:hypothetical protein